MTRPSNLTEFLKDRCIEAARAAMAAGGGKIDDEIAERLVNDLLRDPKVTMRVKQASPQERAKVADEIPAFVHKLKELGFAPPKMPKMPDNKMNVEADDLKAMLDEGAATVVAKADEALKLTSGDAEPPSQSDMAAWVGHCPPKVLIETVERLAAMWGEDVGKVHITGWAFGGLVVWRNGREFHAPASDLVDEAFRRKIPNPLAPLVRAWLERPLPVPRNEHSGPGIMPASHWQMRDSAPRAARLSHYFPQPAHFETGEAGTQILLPGFVDSRSEGLPSEFWNALAPKDRSNIPSVAQRLVTYAPTQLNLDDREPLKAKAVTVPLSKLRDSIWPDTGATRGRIRPREMLEELELAAKMLDDFAINCIVQLDDGRVQEIRHLRPLLLGSLTTTWTPSGRSLVYEDSEIELIVTLPPGVPHKGHLYRKRCQSTARRIFALGGCR